MGMDMYRFQLKKFYTEQEIKALSEKEANIIAQMEVTPKVKAWLDKQGVSKQYIILEEDYDEVETIKHNPHLHGCTPNNWNLSKTKDENWIEFIYIPEIMQELKYEVDENRSIIDANEPTTQATQIHTICAEQIHYKMTPYIYYMAKEVGYMRKPFRHEETPSRVEGDSVVITVTNFSGKGKEAYTAMKEYDAKQVEQSNVVIFTKEAILSLKEFCYAPENYQEQFLNNLQDNEFVSIDW